MTHDDGQKLEVLVVIPCLTRGGVHPRFFQSFIALDLPPKESRAVLVPVDRPTTSSRSDAVRLAKELDAESLLFLDSDMEFQPDLYNRLKQVPGDISCCLFWQRRVPSHPTICKKKKAEDGTDLLETIIPDETVQEIDACGMAATLIRKPVLRWAEYPAFQHLGWMSEDFHFCLRAKEAGFKIFCDTSIKVAHRGDIAFNGQPILSYDGMNDLSFPFGEVGDGSVVQAV